MTLTIIYIVIFSVVFIITYKTQEHITKLNDTILTLDGIYVQQGDIIVALREDLLMLDEAFSTTSDSLNEVIEECAIKDIRIDELEQQMNEDYGLAPKAENTHFCMACGEYTKEIDCLCT